jgi:K+-transporting ATPase KdpF subunit
MILALAITGDDLVGIIIAVLVAAYLVFALLKPEKL